MQKKTPSTKDLHDAELTSMHKLVDSFGKENEALQSENGKLKADLEEVHTKMKTAKKDTRGKQKKMPSGDCQHVSTSRSAFIVCHGLW